MSHPIPRDQFLELVRNGGNFEEILPSTQDPAIQRLREQYLVRFQNYSRNFHRLRTVRSEMEEDHHARLASIQTQLATKEAVIDSLEEAIQGNVAHLRKKEGQLQEIKEEVASSQATLSALQKVPLPHGLIYAYPKPKK